MVAKLLASAALTVTAALVIAPPASADPSVFNDLSCGCPQTVSNDGSVADQIDRGVVAGLAGDPSAETPQ